MIYKHASVVRIDSEDRIIVKPGKQESRVKLKAEVVEKDGRKRVKGRKYELVENIELPFAMTDAEFKFWKENNEEINELIDEKEKNMAV